jgi:hypothetical protein
MGAFHKTRPLSRDVSDITSAFQKSGDLLYRRICALGLGANEVALIEPGLLLDLRSECALCDSQLQCDMDLRQDSTDNRDIQAWQEYCSNVATLNMLSCLLPAVQKAPEG